MSKKGNASDLIMEIIKLIFMITFIYLAFSWGVLTNENGSINYSGLLFIIVILGNIGCKDKTICLTFSGLL